MPSSPPAPTARRFPTLLIVMLLTVALSACADTRRQGSGQPTDAPPIADLLSENERFHTLVAALDSAGLLDTLRGEAPYTMFAPTDDAFDKLPEGTMEDLLQPEYRDRLTAILTYHLTPGTYPAHRVQERPSLPTREGSDVSISNEHGTIEVSGAAVLEADLEANNGIVHVIDAVLVPPADEEAL